MMDWSVFLQLWISHLNEARRFLHKDMRETLFCIMGNNSLVFKVQV
jgi:hypothetical protein